MNLAARAGTSTFVAAIGVVALSSVKRTRPTVPEAPSALVERSPELAVVGVEHEQAAPYAALFVPGASWTLPCWEETQDREATPDLSGPTRTLEPISERRCDAIGVREVAGAKIAGLRCGHDLRWYAMTRAGLYAFGPPSWPGGGEPNGAFGARDIARLRGHRPLLDAIPRAVTWFVAPTDPNTDRADPYTVRHVEVTQQGEAWCVSETQSEGGGPHLTIRCFGPGGLVGLWEGGGEDRWRGVLCGQSASPRPDD